MPWIRRMISRSRAFPLETSAASLNEITSFDIHRRRETRTISEGRTTATEAPRYGGVGG